MYYQHQLQPSRRLLAAQLLVALAGRDFQQGQEGGEIVMRRTFPSGKVLKVYTSVHEVGGVLEVAQVGMDAIRFVVEAPVRKGGYRAVFPTQKRVNRIGEQDEIVGRVMQASKNLFEKAGKLGYCSHCHGFLGISKKNNPYCLNLCFQVGLNG
jgi:cytochrome c553